MLFTTDPELATRAEEAGINFIVVDWENKGKASRQSGFNTEINFDTPEDVRELASILTIPIIVRINQLGEYTASEVEQALDCGANVLMLPMARSAAEVSRFLDIVDARARTLVQVESLSLVAQLQELKELPWDLAYLGFNDLMVEGGRHLIWDVITDGLAEKICSGLRGRRYGFGGCTVVGGGGEPIINTLILHEMVRLGCSIVVMRRTFKRELLDRDLKSEMDALRAFFKCSERRGAKAIQSDHEQLMLAFGRCV